MVKHQNFDQIKVGDVIWEKTATTGGHVVVVTSMPDADGYYYTCDGNNGDEVSWDSWNNINYLINNPDRVAASYVYSRY